VEPEPEPQESHNFGGTGAIMRWGSGLYSGHTDPFSDHDIRQRRCLKVSQNSETCHIYLNRTD
jgi:hypothetical protein